MFKHLNKKRQKGQSTLEYAVLIVIIIAALLAMNTYIKRGLQGRLKSSTDDIGDQFSPGTNNGTKTTRSHSKANETFGVTAMGTQKSTLVDQDYTNVTSNYTATGNITADFMPGAN